MLCPKCGKENDENAASCGNCGVQFSAMQSKLMSQNQLIGVDQHTHDFDSIAIDSEKLTDEKTQNAINQTEQHLESARKRRRIAITLVSIVVLIAVAVSAFMAINSPDVNEEEFIQETMAEEPMQETVPKPQLSDIPIRESVNDYFWDELSVISGELSKSVDEASAIEIAKEYNLCTSAGKLDGTQVKSITLSNGTDIDVQIVGFCHDDKSEAPGKAGITFSFKDAIAEKTMNPTDTNSGGWENSEMRSWLQADGLDILPDDLKNNLVEVEKPTNNTGQTSSIASVTLTSDKLWLFSATELCGAISRFGGGYIACNDVLNSEGTQYKLYRDVGINALTDNGVLVKWFEGGPGAWWNRSPFPGMSSSFMYVKGGGYPIDYLPARGLMLVVPGFCI